MPMRCLHARSVIAALGVVVIVAGLLGNKYTFADDGSGRLPCPAGSSCVVEPFPGTRRAETGPSNEQRNSRRWRHAVVAADHPAAGAAGVEILKQGGNVVDAAVATAFVLSVVRPESCGIGGGGFMVIWNAGKQQAIALDYRERAPQRASKTMFQDPDNPKRSQPLLSRRGHLAVAVPGSVAGWCYAQQTYGRLKLATVMAPALRLARKGVPVGPVMRRVQKLLLKKLEDDPKSARKYAALKRLYLNDGKPWAKGDRFVSPQRKVLERIARHGTDGFYKGPVANAIVKEMGRGGGLMTHEDLAGTAPVVRKPVTGSFNGYSVLSMPPPSSGGVALIQMLNTLSAYEHRHDRRLEKLGHNSHTSIHLLTELMKHAFADRAAFLGDPDFADVPVKRLLSKTYAKQLADKIKRGRTFPPKYYGRFQPASDAGTSHFSVIDAEGNAVACTETINLRFGSWVVEPEYGIVFNNEMDDFSAVPGQANAFGLIQSQANAVEPGKKPLSSMSPTIVLKDGRAVLAAGASGGPRIISSTLQVLLNVLRFDMPPEMAVRRPRFHHQWIPNTLYLEPKLFKQFQTPLRKLGHEVKQRDNLSATQAATRSSNGLRGASDPRKHGTAAGY